MKKIGFMLFLVGIILTIACSYQLMLERKTVTQYQAKQTITQNQVNKTDDKEIQQNPNELIEEEQKITKAVNYQTGDQIAELIVPSIHQTIPVFLGVDHDVLKKGAGMYQSQWTTIPSEKGHTVLSGHRDTVFREIRFVKKGEQLELLFQGERYEYVVNKIWITEKDDRSVITEKNQPTLTLTTCYPFYYWGHAPKRYIIEATLKEKNSIAEISQ